ncbi:MAG TPA: hypothetical protein VGM18_05070 [Candidatus Sulfotelmatobacter sp.]|jgi:hypothetical protein
MTAKEHGVLLGYKVGSGEPVTIPLRHLCVTGQTQEAGKTTALEALIARSGKKAIAFVTKRGEKSFESGRKIPPYFQERVDWEFVESILEAIMRQKMKFERAWIVRATRGAHTLADVRLNVATAMEKAKRGLDADVYMMLGEYLDKILPLLARLPKADRIDLQPGLNVMDLRQYPEELQMLIVSSSVRWVHQREDEVITVLPEAWKFAPQGRNTPVIVEVRKIAREGAGLKNYLWIDSQDIAGVEKEILRGAAVWLLGVQREANEIERALKSIPKGIKRPDAGEIPRLGLGEFFACWGQHVEKVYVQPAWMYADDARSIAMGEADAHNFIRISPAKSEDENMDFKAAYEQEAASLSEAQKTIRELETRIADLEGLMLRNSMAQERKAPAPAARANEPANGNTVKRSPADINGEVAMALERRIPVIDVSVRKYVIEADDSTLKGRLAVLISQNFFDSAKTGNAAYVEMQRRGFSTAKPNVYRELDKLAEMGFLTKEGTEGYRTVSGMKVNVKEVRTVA